MILFFPNVKRIIIILTTTLNRRRKVLSNDINKVIKVTVPNDVPSKILFRDVCRFNNIDTLMSIRASYRKLMRNTISRYIFISSPI